MTQDEIIELAMAYGFTGGFDANGNQTYDATFVKAVAEAVAKEREACCADDIVNSANIMANDMPHTVIEKYQAAIRARGEI